MRGPTAVANPADHPTGAELADALRQEAKRRGIPLSQFTEPLQVSNGFMKMLHNAKKPRAITVARIRALIAGEPLPQPARQIVVTVSDKTWRTLSAEARRTNALISNLAATLITECAEAME